MNASDQAVKVAEQKQAETAWTIDGSHSGAHFSVRHMMVSNVRGEFSRIEGTVMLNPQEPGKALVEATIDASSIQTREPARDEHLRSGDFFDVARFPSITFRSTRIEGDPGEGYRVTGDLTIRGVTRSVVLDVEPLSPETRDPYGNVRVGTSATTRIRRSDFGLSWNALLEAGGVVVGDEVRITLDVELFHKIG